MIIGRGTSVVASIGSDLSGLSGKEGIVPALGPD